MTSLLVEPVGKPVSAPERLAKRITGVLARADVKILSTGAMFSTTRCFESTSHAATITGARRS